MSSNHTIAIIGANGQVGKELCFLLRESGVEVIPIVRNKIGASVFQEHDFDYRKGEITDDEDATRLLAGADTIVVTAFVPWFYAQYPNDARKTNHAIVRNAVEYAPPDASVIYFSTLVAFGKEIGLSNWQWYGREKRWLESRFQKVCDQTDTDGYIYRLGHVYGPTQDHTRTLVDELRGRGSVRIPVGAEKPSNVVHTVTLRDAILRGARGNEDPGRYSVVNRPQWTWGEVFEYYFPDTTVHFDSGVKSQTMQSSFTKRVLMGIIGRFTPKRDLLVSPLIHFPTQVSYYLNNVRNTGEIEDDITKYLDRNVYHMDHFGYSAMPGPYVDVPTVKDPVSQEKVVIEKLIEKRPFDRIGN